MEDNASNEKTVLASSTSGDHPQWDPLVEKKLVRKLDWVLMPLMILGYSLVYYDKAILGGAVVFGMSSDLHLRVVNPVTKKVNTQRLSWATSLFYFGMLAGLFPLTYLFQRFHMGRTVGSIVIIWGIVAMATAGVTDYKGLYAQRFFLGFCESIVPTCYMVTVSNYYTQSEQTWRQCLWYASTGSMTVIGALLNFAFAHIRNAPLKSWQYLYLFAGSVTVLLGVCLFFLPDSPSEAWFLSPSERIIAKERLRSGQLGTRVRQIKWSQIRESLLDVKVWVMTMMMGIAYVINGAIAGFGPLIVSTFGWSAYDSLLLQMPLGGLCFVGILLVGYLSLKFRNLRLIMLACCCLPVIAGSAMIWKSTWYKKAATPIAGYTILGTFAPVTSLIVSIGMVNVAGASKKSFVAAATFVFYCVGNIVGPQLIESQTVGQHYPRLWTAVIVCYALLIVLAAGLYVHLRRENHRREALGLDKAEGDRIAFDDLTDKQNMHFRYAY